MYLRSDNKMEQFMIAGELGNESKEQIELNTINLEAAAMAINVYENLRNFVFGDNKDFLAVFMTSDDDWVTESGLGLHEKVHRLAFEKLKVITEAVVTETSQGKFVTMSVNDRENDVKKAVCLTYLEQKDPETQKVYLVQINS